MITYHKIQVEDCNGRSVRTTVFYREAGSAEKPAILLLHGFPSSSHMFRELMPELADEGVPAQSREIELYTKQIRI